MSDLLEKLEEVQELQAENAAKADRLTPRSQEAYADASDTKRATRDIPDEISGLESYLDGGFEAGLRVMP